MDLHHIRYFLAVCETLNFTRAAEACNVTQPALSRAIQQLEDEVGGLLFRRERNLTHLTDLGQLMRPRLAQVMEAVGSVKREAKEFLTLETANLTVGIMCTVGPTRFTGLLADFRMRYPGISLKLIEGVPAQLSTKLEKGEIDVAPKGDAFAGETLRLRKLVIQPGGIVPWHDHASRPANIYVVSGTVTEYRSNCAVPIVHKAGDTVAEYGAELAHWWKNTGSEPVVLISADLFQTGKMDDHMM